MNTPKTSSLEEALIRKKQAKVRFARDGDSQTDGNPQFGEGMSDESAKRGLKKFAVRALGVIDKDYVGIE